MSDPAKAVRAASASPLFPDVVLTLQPRGEEPSSFCAGALSAETPYFAASVAKLFTTCLILQLCDEGRLHLDEPFRPYLSGTLTDRLSVVGGVDRTGAIQIRHLLSHTSGLPDYFESSDTKKGLCAEVLRGADRAWSFADAMDITRRLGARHAPGTVRRAHYSDSNFQILGQIVETLDSEPFAVCVQRRICAPLGLAATRILAPGDTAPFLPARRGRNILQAPLALSSFGADGGLVTTSRDSVIFLEALLSGRLFSRSSVARMEEWRPLFFPISYGLGLMRFRLPAFMTGLKPLPALIGHSGLSGAFAFATEDRRLFMAGTVNQVSRQAAPFQLMARCL